MDMRTTPRDHDMTICGQIMNGSRLTRNTQKTPFLNRQSSEMMARIPQLFRGLGQLTLKPLLQQDYRRLTNRAERSTRRAAGKRLAA